jgi:hypothetical protein
LKVVGVFVRFVRRFIQPPRPPIIFDKSLTRIKSAADLRDFGSFLTTDTNMEALTLAVIYSSPTIATTCLSL